METKPFACSYYYDHSQWALTIHAYDWIDAEARCKKLGLKLDGEMIATLPAGAGLIAKAVCFIRNLIK